MDDGRQPWEVSKEPVLALCLAPPSPALSLLMMYVQESKNQWTIKEAVTATSGKPIRCLLCRMALLEVAYLDQC